MSTPTAMRSGILFAALVSFLSPVSAGILKVGPGETYTTIQAAIAGAAPGDTIEVGPGLYPENVVVTKSPLALLGAQAGTDARGRVAGVPDPLVETVVSPVAGAALEFASGAGPITVSGFTFAAAAPAGGGVVSADTLPLDALTFSDNHLQVGGGAVGSALSLRVEANDATLSGNVFLAAAGSSHSVFLDGAFSFDGLRFSDNDVLRDGPMAHIGLFVDGDRNVGPSAARTPLFQGNRFEGHGLGFHGGARSLDGGQFVGNSIVGNERGMAAGPRNMEFRSNQWVNNSIYGLRLTGFGETGNSDFGVQSTVIEENDFQGNGTVVDPAGYGDLVVNDQAPGTHISNTVARNRFGSGVAVWSDEGDSTVDVAYNYWGASDGPGGSAPGSGGALVGSPVTYRPFYTDSGFASLDFAGTPLAGNVVLEEGVSIGGNALVVASTGNLTIERGATIEVDTLDLQSGAVLSVRGGKVRVGKLELQAGAVLEVVDGELSLDPMASGLYHTISGTFSFFNSLGSLHINGDTSFAGSALCLVSNIHVSSGVTLLVLGELVLDGCRMDSSGTFNILVNTGATFDMRRCAVSGAFVNLVGSGVMLRDNEFSNSLITVFSTVNGANVYHNVFHDGLSTLAILPGAIVNTTVEGWSNVDDPALVENALSLNFRSPADSTRTLDGGGNLYIQPGDPLSVGFDVANLNAEAQAVESLMGFSTNHLQLDELMPSAEWPNDLYEFVDESAAIGRINAALGLRFDYPDPDGTSANGEIAEVKMVAQSIEGQTRFFFRTPIPADSPVADTRLTVSAAGVPSFRNAPFTRNSAIVTIDGTAPAFGDSSASQVQGGSPVDVLSGGALTYRGTVTVAFDAADALAGIDDTDATLVLSDGANTVMGNLTGTSPISYGGNDYTRYLFELAIGAGTPNGVYDLDGAVMDRSGNSAVLPIGTLEVSRNEIAVVVEPQGLVTGPLVRDVEFIATDGAGGVLATWVEPVDFSAGSGSVVLSEVPENTAWLSAKTAWNLRVRLAVAFDPAGLASVAFTGAAILPGGDLNGDNLVTLADYNILRSPSFPRVATDADINGDGIVNVADYNLLRSNWLTGGDPQ